MAMNLVLVEIGPRKVILDTGVGLKNIGKLRSYGFHSLVDIAKSIEELGFHPHEITDVVLSHLHFDHCGGNTYFDDNGDIQLTFPQATHWVSRDQWKNYKSPTLLDEDSYLAENIDLVEKAGLLRIIDHDEEIFEDFKLLLYNGHTPGQIVSVFNVDKETFCYAGDVIPTAAHLSPTWISPYDLYPVDSVKEKIRLLEQAASKNWNLITYHDVYNPIVSVKKVNDFYKIKQVYCL